MDKTEAIRRLGGTPAEAARRVGISTSAVSQWPDPLPQRIADRVIAAIARAEAAGKRKRSPRVATPAQRDAEA